MSTEHISQKQYLCCYTNTTKRIQVGKIYSTTSGWEKERVIFPSEKLLFEAAESSELAIYTELAGETILLDTIACSRLQTQTVSSKTLELVR